MIRPERIEKAVLRKVFDCCLPDSTLGRQKEQFDNSVGYECIDKLKVYVAFHVSDRDFSMASACYPIDFAAVEGGISVSQYLRAEFSRSPHGTFQARMRQFGAPRKIDRLLIASCDCVG